MGHALKKPTASTSRQAMIKRAATARPAEGAYQAQIEKAFCTAFHRYEKAFEDLAKV